MTQAAAPPTLPDLAVRVAAIVQAVTGGVMARTHRAPTLWYGVLIPMALAILINQWIARRRQRILDLMARIAAGTQRAPRADKVRNAAAQDQAEAAGPVRRAALRMPRWRGWLITLAQEIRIQGRYLAAVMDEAAMREAVMAHPQLGRLMMPLLRMLGEKRPAWMPPAPKRRRRRAYAAPKERARPPAPAADDRSVALERMVAEAAETYRRKTAPPPPAALAVRVAEGAALPLGFPRLGEGGGSVGPPCYGGVFGRRFV